MRKLVRGSWAVAAFFSLLSCSTVFAGTTQLWEVSDGLANPESVLPDIGSGVLYVSNVNGKPDEKNGKGFISKVSVDGKIIDLKWGSGLNGPKGLALADGKLYVADIDKLVELDTKDGKILKRYPAKDAKFLNDVAADQNGNVYVSDTMTDTIWRLSDGRFEVWLQDAKLEHPNGLLVEGNQLRVAAWGVMTDGFATKVPGHLLTVDLDTKVISGMADSKPFGNLDGLEPLGGGNYVISDWMAGNVMTYGPDGKAQTILELGKGAADVGYAASSNTLYVPQMLKSTLRAYKVD